VVDEGEVVDLGEEEMDFVPIWNCERELHVLQLDVC
jgi:hypothetical protein